MKKITTLLATIAVSASLLVGCGGSGKYVDGTYNGEGKGASGPIKVEVKVEKGEIKEVKLTEHNETSTIVSGVEDNMLPEIVKNQSTEGIEAVSGATKSSQGVLDAVNKALEGAKK